jgi:hypothetical protein
MAPDHLGPSRLRLHVAVSRFQGRVWHISAEGIYPKNGHLHAHFGHGGKGEEHGGKMVKLRKQKAEICWPLASVSADTLIFSFQVSALSFSG